MLIHFACQFEALRSGISRIWKNCHTPENLRNLELFSDPQYSTFKRSKIACKVKQLPLPGAVRICVILDVKGWITLHASSEHLEVEFRRFEKSARILTSSGIWHFFHIFKIPLVRAPNGHAKCRHFSRQGAEQIFVRCMLGRLAQHSRLWFYIKSSSLLGWSAQHAVGWRSLNLPWGVGLTLFSKTYVRYDLHLV